MIKVGDRVKFLSETLSGIVKSIDGTTAVVLTEDDFEIPAMLSDLIAVDNIEEQRAKERIGYDQPRPGGGTRGAGRSAEPKHNAAKREVPRYGRITLEPEFDDEDESSEEGDEQLDMSDIRRQIVNGRIAQQDEVDEPRTVEPSPLEQTDYKLRLVFEPQGDLPENEADVVLWLDNSSSYRVYYTLATEQSDNRSVKMSAHGEIEPRARVRIMQIDRAELSSAINIVVNAILYKETVYIPHEPVMFRYQTQPVKFVRRGCYVQIDGYRRPSVCVDLASDKTDPMLEHLDPVEIIRALKQKGDVKPTQRQRRNDQPEVVDLHAEEIFSSIEGMAPGEILQGQIGRFELALDLALKSGRSGRMVFIHGVGSGKLKHEIKRILTTKYKKLRFQDASFAEYGYGAIMVFLK